MSQTCVFIKLLPCSQNKDTWVHPGLYLEYREKWPEVEGRNDSSSDEHEQHPGRWPSFPSPHSLAPGAHSPKAHMLAHVVHALGYLGDFSGEVLYFQPQLHIEIN